jgi:hypothetical protein
MEIMDYSDNICGCCKMDSFEDWYQNNEAYFVKKGVFLMDGLLNTEKKEMLRYCFLFDFENKEESVFTVINYYTREKIAVFKNKRTEDWKNPEITVEYFDKKKFKDFGRFTNSIIKEKVLKQWDIFIRRNSSLPNNKYKEQLKKFEELEDKMVSEFMWEHTVDIIHCSFFYFTLEKPKQIEYKEFIEEEKKETEITSSSGKVVKYYYTGYVNLNETKIYRTNISEELKSEKSKRGEYQRHIEQWSVRGHYRTINGKKIWIEPHVKGTGNLENRLYGVSPESEMNLIPKVFEVVKNKTEKDKDKTEIEVEVPPMPIELMPIIEENKIEDKIEFNPAWEIKITKNKIETPPLMPPTTLWNRIKKMVYNIYNKIFK